MEYYNYFHYKYHEIHEYEKYNSQSNNNLITIPNKKIELCKCVSICLLTKKPKKQCGVQDETDEQIQRTISKVTSFVLVFFKSARLSETRNIKYVDMVLKNVGAY